MLTRQRIDALHRWGSGLASSGATEDVRAAGRAIQLLVDHIDTLELARRQDVQQPGRGEVEPHGETRAPGAPDSVLGALADRIGTRP